MLDLEFKGTKERKLDKPITISLFLTILLYTSSLIFLYLGSFIRIIDSVTVNKRC